MPKAGLFSIWQDQEFTVARECFLKHVRTHTARPLEQVPQSTMLVNPKNNVKYFVYPVQGVFEDTGGYLVYYDCNTDLPLYCTEQCDWLVIMDLQKSKALLVQAAAWLHKVAIPELKNGGLVQEVRCLPTQDQWVPLLFNFVPSPKKAGDAKTKLLAMSFTMTNPEYAEYRDRTLATSEDFVHLHCHSMYSLLDGVPSVKSMARRAAANGQPGMGLTDHGFMMGTYKFYEACKEQEIKPLLGVEFYVVDDVTKYYHTTDGGRIRFSHHQTVMAMNQRGWENLCHLCTIACRDYYYHEPRIDLDTLLKFSEGLIITTGCFRGMVAWFLQEKLDPKDIHSDDGWMYRVDPDRSWNILKKLKQALGDRLYVEVQSIDFQQYAKIMPKLVQMGDDAGVNVVITNDCHFEQEEDRILQSILRGVNSKEDSSADDDPDGYRAMVQKGCHFIKQRHEITHPCFTTAMFDRTCEIMERCTVSLDRDEYMWPNYQIEADPDYPALQEHLLSESAGAK